MVQEFATVDVVRLEVETDPEGLVNLVANPDGELGGWGWITPVPDTRMRKGLGPGATHLTYESTVAQASHFATEPGAVAAGDWVAAFFNLPFATSGCTIRARFEFLDDAGSVVSSGAQTGYLSAVGDYTLAAEQVPSGAVWVRLRADLYDGSTSSPPESSASVFLRQVTVATAATSGELGETRSNLAPNPSFELDAAGWVGVNADISRVTSPAGQSGAACLQVVASFAGESGAVFGVAPWPTRLVPIAAATEYRISMYVNSAAASRQARVRAYWHDTSGAVLGFDDGTGTATSVGSWVRLDSGAVTPPAAATHVRVAVLIADVASSEVHYLDSLLIERPSELRDYFDGDAASSSEVTYDWLAFPTSLVRSRTNLVPNPSAEVTDSPWVPAVRVSTSPRFGSACLYAQGGFVGIFPGVTHQEPYIPVTPGVAYTLSAYLRTGSVGAAGNAEIEWHDAPDGVLNVVGSTAVGPAVALSTSEWRRVTLTAVPPTGATHARLIFRQSDDPGGVRFTDLYVDGVLLEQTNEIRPYFDGSTSEPQAFTAFTDRGWSGAAHDSTSTQTETVTLPYSIQTSTNLGYIPPNEYLNVLPESHQIRVTRDGLNVGELHAVILSRALNPAQSTLIRPGRRARLTTLVDDTWETILGGKLLEADVSYVLKDPKIPDEKRARVEVTIVDPLQALANAGRPEGVATIDELPFVLEGAGVPWSINGFGSQVATATVTTYNENAHAVDQVALTRDTAIGYAWMARVGVLTAWDRDQIPSGSPVLLDEDDYSDLDLSFSTKDAINEVQITVQSLGVNGDTTETIYGPYTDAASIREWGRYRKEFTVTGLDSTAVDDLAAAILAANATPRIRVNSITLPLTTNERREARALLDLYDETEVVLTAEDVDDTLRVTGIEHVIDTDKWMLKLTFSDVDGVASPTMQPPVQAGARPDVGVIEDFAGTLDKLPTTKLLCDGASYAVADYPHLFSVIGYTWGGSGEFFNVPNLVDRFAIGAGVKALGTVGGSPTKSLSAGNIPKHTHPIDVDYVADVPTNGSGIRVHRVGGAGAGGSGGTHGTGNTNTNSGSGSSFDVMPPWAGVYKVIRAA